MKKNYNKNIQKKTCYAEWFCHEIFWFFSHFDFFTLFISAPIFLSFICDTFIPINISFLITFFSLLCCYREIVKKYNILFTVRKFKTVIYSNFSYNIDGQNLCDVVNFSSHRQKGNTQIIYLQKQAQHSKESVLMK